MNQDQGANVIWSLGALVLVGTSLLARGLPLRQATKMAAAWIGIFAVVLLGVSQRDLAMGLWSRALVEVDPARGLVDGGAIRIPKSDDGHFWVRGSVNGVAARFLVDSGASTTALSTETIAAADIVPDAQSAVRLDTANGAIIAQQGRVARLQIGPITRLDLSIVTAPAFGDQNVLGMNFLSSLHGWSVEGDWLELRP